MGAETLYPNSLDVQSNLSGSITDVQDDPSSSDGNWLTAISNTTDTIARVSFPTPSADLVTGSGTQAFRALWRGTDTTKTPDDLSMYLYENDTLVGTAPVYTQANPSGIEAVVTGYWDAASLSNIDGSLVQLHIRSTADASPPAQVCVGEYGAFAWDVTYVSAGTNYERTLNSNIDVADPQDRLLNRGRVVQSILENLTDGDVERLLQANYITANNVTANDLIARAIEASSQTYSRILQSGVTVYDDLTRDLIGLYERVLQDNILVNDELISAVAALYERILQSNIDVTDDIIRELLKVGVSRVLVSNLSVTDGDVERVLNANYVLTNSVTIADLIVRTLQAASQTYNRSLLDSVDINDAMNRELYIYYERLLQDNLDISDNLISFTAALLERSLISNITVSDYLSRDTYLFFAPVLQSYIDVNDNLISQTARLVERVLQSEIDISDSLYREIAVGLTVRILSDTITINDGQVERYLIANYIADNGIDISDAIIRTTTAVQTIQRTLQDNVNLYDVIIRTIEAVTLLTRTLSDNIELYDLTGNYRLLEYVIFDGLDISDLITRTIQTTAITTRTLQDYIDIDDLNFRELIAERLLADNAEITDNLIRQHIAYIILSRVLQDSLSTTDTLSREWLSITARTLQDTISVDDLIARTTYVAFQLVRTLLDSTVIADNLQVQKWLDHKLADSIDVYDLVSKLLQGYGQHNRSLIDEVGVADTLETQRLLTTGLVSTINVLDTLLPRQWLIRLLQDNPEVFDDLTKLVSRKLWEYVLRDNLTLLDSLNRSFYGQIVGFIKVAIQEMAIDVDIEELPILTDIRSFIEVGIQEA